MGRRRARMGTDPHRERSTPRASLRSNFAPLVANRGVVGGRGSKVLCPVAGDPRPTGGAAGSSTGSRHGAACEPSAGGPSTGHAVTKRTRRGVAGSVLVVLGLVIAAVIVTALQAEGRERSKADTNDGGAWLLKQDAGYVGHVNRLVGEVTAAVSVSDPGSDFDVDQAPGIIVVHDRTTGLVTVVDDSVE